MRQSIVVPSDAPQLTTSTTVDCTWHAQNSIETFYSPPRYFISCSTIITILLVVILTCLISRQVTR